MKKHIIYIATDANRSYFEARYTQELSTHANNLQFQIIGNARLLSSKLNRIVHIEEFTNHELAQKRLIELSSFTRMQKEKLIRRYNPNWLNMSTSYNHLSRASNLQANKMYARTF